MNGTDDGLTGSLHVLFGTRVSEQDIFFDCVFLQQGKKKTTIAHPPF
jgi:hypothetical protein